MLANAEIIAAVAAAVRAHKIPKLVIDTVMVSKSSHRLLASEAEAAMRSTLLPLAFIVTPNLPEAEVLTGMKITNLAAMREAAQKLFALGAKHVLVKGGHLEDAPATDVFFDGKEFTEITAERVDTTSTHGTGCTLSAAIAAYLAQGLSPLEACRSAKHYLTGALRNAVKLGHGHGPVNHFWNLT
jgi:hydroxymethylpyrimidine/phosphomethylpyrimidine kinase